MKGLILGLFIIEIIVLLLVFGLIESITVHKDFTSFSEQSPNNTNPSLDCLYDVVVSSSEYNIIVVSHFPPVDDMRPDKKAIDPPVNFSTLDDISLWVYGHLHLTPFYNDSEPLVCYRSNTILANSCSLDDSYLGETSPTSVVLYLYNGSKTGLLCYRNHENNTWIYNYTIDFSYPSGNSVVIWFYSDIGDFDDFLTAIDDINLNIKPNYSFGVGDLSSDKIENGYLFNNYLKSINANNYYVLGNHDVRMGNGEWSLFPRFYYVDISNSRFVCWSPTYENNY